MAKSLRYVKEIKTDDEPVKGEIIQHLKKGFKEMKLFKERNNLKTTAAKDFLNEL